LPEDRKKGNISLSVFKEYFKLNGGWKYSFSVFLAYSGWLGLRMASNIWIKYWTTEGPVD